MGIMNKALTYSISVVKVGGFSFSIKKNLVLRQNENIKVRMKNTEAMEMIWKQKYAINN